MADKALPTSARQALDETAPLDTTGGLAAHVEKIPGWKKSARARGEAVLNRKLLAIAFSGEDRAALNAISEAYAAVLDACEVTPGRDAQPGPWVHHVEWRDLILDADGRYLERRKATDAAYAAKSAAENGVLVIHNVFEPPASIAADNAKNGALDQICALLLDYADKDYTPALVLTGTAEGIGGFFAKNRYLAEQFSAAAAIPVAAMPVPPAPEISVATETAVTVRKPLQLKPPAR